MKAERRHDLKTNALARGIENAPQMWREHGNKLMLLLIAVLLVIILVRYRMAESALRDKTAKDALSKAEAELAELQELPFSRTPGGIDRRQFWPDCGSRRGRRQRRAQVRR